MIDNFKLSNVYYNTYTEKYYLYIPRDMNPYKDNKNEKVLVSETGWCSKKSTYLRVVSVQEEGDALRKHFGFTKNKKELKVGSVYRWFNLSGSSYYDYVYTGNPAKPLERENGCYLKHSAVTTNGVYYLKQYEINEHPKLEDLIKTYRKEDTKSMITKTVVTEEVITQEEKVYYDVRFTEEQIQYLMGVVGSVTIGGGFPRKINDSIYRLFNKEGITRSSNIDWYSVKSRLNWG